MNKLLDWLDHRTGYRAASQEALYEHIPSGARWRYVFGSTLVFAFVTQVITGLFLWMAYSPSSQTAWESVYYIQHEMQGGWLLRGVHHFMAQAMVVLLALHLLQVIIDKAYQAPREVNFWLGLVLMQIVLGLSLTGYLLPWDQKGYWATSVATNLMTLVPFVGEDLQRLVVGGTEYGHHTLTRFFALHAGILPVLLMMFLAVHIGLFRKHGLHAVISPRRRDAYFWPDQVLLDAVACLAVMAIVFLLAIHFDFRGLLNGELNSQAHGAELGAPADPSQQYSAARPEWYFLFLFQLLKYFPGALEIIGAIVLPGLVMFILFMMPLTAKLPGGHAFNVAFIFVVLGGAGLMTFLALQDDYYVRFYAIDEKKLEKLAADPDKQNAYLAPFRTSETYLEAVEAAHHESARILELIQYQASPDGPAQLIPKEGAVALLRGDPLTQGPKLFERNCSSCHAHSDLDETLAAANPKFKEEQQISAPDLDQFASRAWVAGLLDPERIDSAEYFGNTAHKEGRMSTWVKEHMKDHLRRAELTPAELADDAKLAEVLKKLKVSADAQAVRALTEKAKKDKAPATLNLDKDTLEATVDIPTVGNKDVPESAKISLQATSHDFEDIVIALSAQARLSEQAELDAKAAKDGRLARGIDLIKTTCAKGCHKFGDAGQLGLAPDLTGYGSWEWSMGMISHPEHRRFYGPENDRMPAFAEKLDKPEENPLSAHQISLIVDWLRGDYVGGPAKVAALPHTAQQAQQELQLARLIDSPERSVVGAPPAGTLTPTQLAEKLFTQNCAACHSKTNEHGVGIVAAHPSAPNLGGFASRAWIEGLLDPEKIASSHFFGDTKHVKGDMVGFVQNDLDRDSENFAAAIIALSAEAALPAQKELDAEAEKEGILEKGREAIISELSCVDCHEFRGEGEGGYGPILTDYGSLAWLTSMISDPSAEGFYPDTNDRMPHFGGHGKRKAGAGPGTGGGQNGGPGQGHHGRLLPRKDIELIARWLRGEDLSQAAISP